MELEMYRRYSQMARGIEKAELVFEKWACVQLWYRRIY